MNIKSRVAIGASTALVLVAWFRDGRAAPHLRPGPSERVVATAGLTSLNQAIHRQGERLRRRLDTMPSPTSKRDPFTFVSEATRTPPVRASAPRKPPVASVVLPPSDPALVLLGLAETERDGRPTRIAIIAGNADEMWILEEGQMLGTRYRVARIGADAAELTDVVAGTTRQLVLR